MSEDITADLPFGVVERSVGRTIGEGEFALLTTLTWTTGELHCNREYCRSTQFGERILGGPVVLALVAGLWANSSHYRKLRERYGVELIAALNVQCDYRGPFYPGDTLWAETELVSARPSKSRPGLGVMTLRDRGVNQRNEVVVEMTRALLFRRVRPDAAGS